jgi:hypothetical protein
MKIRIGWKACKLAFVEEVGVSCRSQGNLELPCISYLSQGDLSKNELSFVFHLQCISLRPTVAATIGAHQGNHKHQTKTKTKTKTRYFLYQLSSSTSFMHHSCRLFQLSELTSMIVGSETSFAIQLNGKQQLQLQDHQRSTGPITQVSARNHCP